jgi:hypothetical protein
VFSALQRLAFTSPTGGSSLRDSKLNSSSQQAGMKECILFTFFLIWFGFHHRIHFFRLFGFFGSPHFVL